MEGRVTPWGEKAGWCTSTLWAHVEEKNEKGQPFLAVFFRDEILGALYTVLLIFYFTVQLELAVCRVSQ